MKPVKLTHSHLNVGISVLLLTVFDFSQRHYLLVLLGASPESSKHYYKRLGFTINNCRLSASEQPGVIKAYRLCKLSLHYRVAFVTSK